VLRSVVILCCVVGCSLSFFSDVYYYFLVFFPCIFIRTCLCVIVGLERVLYWPHASKKLIHIRTWFNNIQLIITLNAYFRHKHISRFKSRLRAWYSAIVILF